MDAKIRKHQNILIISGYSLIAFGLWSIVRTALIRYIDPARFEEFMGYQGDIPDRIFDAVMFAVLLVFLLLDLLLRYYIGSSAIREGNGQKQRISYIILAAFCAAVSVWSDGSSFVRMMQTGFSMNQLDDIIVDLTACVALVEIVRSSVILRKAEKEQ